MLSGEGQGRISFISAVTPLWCQDSGRHIVGPESCLFGKPSQVGHWSWSKLPETSSRLGGPWGPPSAPKELNWDCSASWWQEEQLQP